MTIVVSISQFRQHIADYIEKAKAGNTVVLQDEKKGQQIVKLVRKKQFNPEAFGAALKNASGVFTVENHPEWRTEKDVITWVENGRLASDRNF
jgi:antitoxin (DNA-binding transcriptional repressor) of toxin-antitoxin stability system